MLKILSVTAPFFALIACGYFAARRTLLPENAVPALNSFVLYFALPAMMFRFTIETPFAQILNGHAPLAEPELPLRRTARKDDMGELFDFLAHGRVSGLPQA